MTTFQDKKCIIPKCQNICPWNSFTTMCEQCYNRRRGLSYCVKCRRICDLIDATGESMMIQHIPDWRCIKCGNKPEEYVKLIKGFAYK